MTRPRKKNTRPYEEGSPADFMARLLSLAWHKIKPLTVSDLISDKLLAFHILIFIVISGAAIAHFWLGNDGVFSLGGLLVLFISFLVAFIISYLYAYLTELLVNLVKDKLTAIRISSAILLIGVPLASGGLFFNISVLTHLALGIIAIQMIFLLISNLIEFPASSSEIENAPTRRLTTALGNPLTYISVGSFILTVIMFISAIVKDGLF